MGVNEKVESALKQETPLRFFEIDEQTSMVVELAKWQGCIAATGGPVVAAHSAAEASELYRRWRNGEPYLRGDFWHEGRLQKHVIYAHSHK